MVYRERILRTMVACAMGILTGVISFLLCGEIDPLTGSQPKAPFGILFLAAGIVFQKHIFLLLGIDISSLGGKDWFYQGFMTFALWFVSWTILLSSATLS
ncbi:MAG: EMC6-like membrane protein [Methanoculleaceae archaeon]